MSGPRIPWTERMSRWRAPLDVLTGCYPRFLFGGKLRSGILPVFHFHGVTPSYLEPYLRFLKENDYRTASVDEFLGFFERGVSLEERTVLLTFDDAWASLWTVAAPLLRRFGFRAVAFAIPGRVSEGEGPRLTIDEEPEMSDYGDSGEHPFCRWSELCALDAEGVVEVESHTFAHEQMPVGFLPDCGSWTIEDIEATPLLSRPLVWEGGLLCRPFDHREEGRERCVTRSRMADARRWVEAEKRLENDGEARAAIRRDLTLCRDILETKLGRSPRVLCFPWAVAGAVAREEAQAVGFQVAFSDSILGKRFVHREADPYQLMRLKHEWIYRLPRAS